MTDRVGSPEAVLREAARALLDGMSSTFKARNGRNVGIEADDGEKCYIVHSDLTTALELALAAPMRVDGWQGRHVSGSLLPSNEPRILKPVQTPFGTLQVRVIEALDTHGLFYRHANGESLLATHGNGYSCFKTLEKIVARDREAVTRQVGHMLDCGGTARKLDQILNIFCNQGEAEEQG